MEKKFEYVQIVEHDSFVSIKVLKKLPKKLGGGFKAPYGNIIKNFQYAIIDNVLVGTGEAMVLSMVDGNYNAPTFEYEVEDQLENALYPDDIWDGEMYKSFWDRINNKPKYKYFTGWGRWYWTNETQPKLFTFTNFVMDN